MNYSFKRTLLFFFFLFAIFGLTQNISAQKVRLRSQINPNCGITSITKFADIFADGNIAVQGSYSCKGAFIYDISNADAPVLASWYNPGNNQQFLEAIVVGNRGYFGSGTGNGGVHIVDLTNPYSPVLLGTVDTAHGNGFTRIHEMVVWGDYLIENFNQLSSSTKLIRIINVSNPANPVFVTDINPTDTTWVHAMYIRNNLMYTSGWGGKVEIYDLTPLSTGGVPILRGAINGNTTNHSTWSYDGIVFANSNQTLSASNSSTEFTVSFNQNDASKAERRFGLANSKFAEYSNFLFSFAVRRDTTGAFVGEVVEKNASKANLTVAEGDVLKISVEAGTVKYYKNAQLIYTSQQTLPTQTGNANLLATPLFVKAAIFHLNNSVNNARITNAGATEPIVWKTLDNQISISGNSFTKISGCNDCNYLYNCRETTGGDLRVYDVSNPAQPLLVRSITSTNLNINAISPHNPVVMGNKLYVSWYTAGLQVFDISEPANPKKLGEYDTYAPEFTEEQRQTAMLWEQQNKVDANGEPWDIFCGTNNLRANVPGYDGDWAVYPFLGEDKVLVGDLATGLYIVNVSSKNSVSDFDGDRRTDYSTYSPSTGLWRIEKSTDGSTLSTAFGAPTDKIVAGDYDGDGKSDIAVFRPSDGIWYVMGSTSGFRATQFGASGDVPVAADFDGDGKTDLAVWRPSSGIWYIQQSTLGFRGQQFGAPDDKVLAGDYDGDGKADITVWRPSSGTWYIWQSQTNSLLARQFGASADKPLSGDFDGDGKSDFAVFRPTDGFWYVLNSIGSTLSSVQFGASDDVPVPADYDGDGKADIAVFRASNNAWYRLNSGNGSFSAKVFGQSGDVPSPSSVQP